MAKLLDMRMDVIEAALVQNPTALYFPWNCSDYPYASYPQGIPRASVLAAFQTHAAICKTGMALVINGVTVTYPFNNQSYGNTAAGNTAPVNNAGAIVRAEDVV
jgi:hypothetical protein